MLFQKWDAASSEESKAQPWTNCLQTNPLPLELIARLGLELTENQLPLLKTNQTKPHPTPPKKTQTKQNHHQKKPRPTVIIMNFWVSNLFKLQIR